MDVALGFSASVPTFSTLVLSFLSHTFTTYELGVLEQKKTAVRGTAEQ